MGKKLLLLCRLPKYCLTLGAAAAVCLAASASTFAATNPWSQKQVIQPAALATILQNSGAKPLLLQVGFKALYVQGHIPGSKYCGPGRSSGGIAKLKACLDGVSPKRAIVLYCGCCPWERCPNIRPAFETLKAMGFTNIKVMHIADDFGKDWAAKGYPVNRGE